MAVFWWLSNVDFNKLNHKSIEKLLLIYFLLCFYWQDLWCPFTLALFLHAWRDGRYTLLFPDHLIHAWCPLVVIHDLSHLDVFSMEFDAVGSERLRDRDCISTQYLLSTLYQASKAALLNSLFRILTRLLVTAIILLALRVMLWWWSPMGYLISASFSSSRACKV